MNRSTATSPALINSILACLPGNYWVIDKDNKLIASEHLEEYNKVFRESMQDRDAEKLGNLKHKMNVLLILMELEDLRAAMEKGQRLLEENAPQNKIKRAIKEGESFFDKTADAIKKRTGEIKEELTRKKE